jgi:hypothetical protein
MRAAPVPAETIALRGLAFLAASPDDLTRFMNASGVDAADLRARAAEPEFLAAILDFLLTDDTLLSAFCESETLEPRAIHLARRELPGG